MTQHWQNLDVLPSGKVRHSHIWFIWNSQPLGYKPVGWLNSPRIFELTADIPIPIADTIIYIPIEPAGINAIVPITA